MIRLDRLTIKKTDPPLFLLALYAFVSPLGNLARFGTHEGAYGISTVLMILIILVTFRSSLSKIRNNAILFSLTILVGWMVLSSIFAQDQADAYVKSISLVFYILLAAAAYRYIQNERQILFVVIMFLIGAFMSSTATFIDYFDFVDIPGVNDIRAGTGSKYVGYSMQISGAFPRRSAMAAYYTIAITIGFLMPLLHCKLSRVQQIFYFTTAVSCFFVLMMTHNRAGLIGAVIATTLIPIISARSWKRLLWLMAIYLFFMAIIIFIIYNWFYDVWVAYQILLRIGEVGEDDPSNVAESDILRLVFFQRAMAALLENPFGHGYSLLHGVPGYSGMVDPHNIVTQVIWGMGVFSFFWLIYFTIIFIIKARFLFVKINKKSAIDIGFVLLGGLLAFFLNNMMHNSLSTGVAWIFLGLLLGLINRLKASEVIITGKKS